jgi:BirA family biotin operon repressor/biotin-[acetyl-CoA-carboxylase] ligase
MADGRFHSGAWLGQRLGVSRNAVWKHIRFLQSRQVAIHAVHGRGYRLAGPIELLSETAITAGLPAVVRARIGRLDILPEIDSTNRYLMTRIADGAAAGDVCLAEYQSAGRGRQGRQWLSPFAANIYLSLLWHFPAAVEGLAGLGLVVGVAVLEACHDLGATAVRLKWPNDLVWQGRKLAGVLLELRSSAQGGSHVVIGIGLNVRMPGYGATAIDQPWTDLEQILSQPQSRNRVAAALLTQLIPALERFQQQGAAPFLARWRTFDDLLDRPISLHASGLVVDGIARGIDEYGALRVEHNGRISNYLVGDVSLRVRP